MPARGPAGRSKVAGRVERVLNAGLSGEPTVALSVSAAEILSDADGVAAVISAALDRPGAGLTDHRLVIASFRRSGLSDEILDRLVDKRPEVRAAAARICGALRLPEAVPWIGELVADPEPAVRETAVRALGQAGGRRAVEVLMDSSERIPLYRLAIVLARATSDLDIEALMRRPASEKAAVATVLACGLRRDVLRIPPLLGIAHDRRWPKQVRIAACKALGMIGDPSAADGLGYLAESDPDAGFKGVARRAHRKLLHRAKRVGR